jgi:hypothetical protein
MTQVADFPSGHSAIWPLHNFVSSANVREVVLFALFEMTAMSLAAAIPRHAATTMTIAK